jgi:hypothetical protein
VQNVWSLDESTAQRPASQSEFASQASPIAPLGTGTHCASALQSSEAAQSRLELHSPTPGSGVGSGTGSTLPASMEHVAPPSLGRRRMQCRVPSDTASQCSLLPPQSASVAQSSPQYPRLSG